MELTVKEQTMKWGKLLNGDSTLCHKFEVSNFLLLIWLCLTLPAFLKQQP
jgi:hypothetical protein